MVVAAAVGTAAHRQDVARLRHLVIDLAEGRSHLVGERACANGGGGFGMRAGGAGEGRLGKLSSAESDSSAHTAARRRLVCGGLARQWWRLRLTSDDHHICLTW